MLGKTQKSRRIIQTIIITLVSIFVLGLFLGWIWYENEGKYNRDLFLVKIFPWQNKNFDKLKESYPDIVGWVEVPNTNINLPVVQSPDDDYYYLSHGPDGNHDVFGSAYIELCNKADFSDPVTVIYGHNMLDDSMFATTHYFEDREFFDTNDHFYVYSPGHIFTYKIVSAYAGDDKHIINTNKGFENKDVLLQYFDFVCNPTALIKNVRPNVKLNETDKIVQLSTCMSDLDWNNQRYIVTGYLIDDIETQ